MTQVEPHTGHWFHCWPHCLSRGVLLERVGAYGRGGRQNRLAVLLVCIGLVCGAGQAGGESLGVLENPEPESYQSGIGVISGWVCEAAEVVVEINGGPRLAAAYGTARADTEGECGDRDNGFGLLFNWNLLGGGVHEVIVYVDDRELRRARVTVTTLGEEFVVGVRGAAMVADFPSPGERAWVAWQEGLQNFVLAPAVAEPVSSPEGPRGGPLGMLENPGRGSYQSGIGVISGWVCEAERVEIELDGVVQPAAYGTERADTVEACGDTANGFGLLVNWNELGDGEQTVRVLADGEEVGRATLWVTTLGEAFVREVAGSVRVTDFPQAGAVVDLVWQESVQNFVLTGYEAGPAAAPTTEDAGRTEDSVPAEEPPASSSGSQGASGQGASGQGTSSTSSSGSRGTSSGSRGTSSGSRSSVSQKSSVSVSEPVGGDLPADTSTPGRLVVDSPATGTFSAPVNDEDWFRADLERGYRYTFTIKGGDTDPTDSPHLESLRGPQGRADGNTYSNATRREQLVFTVHKTQSYYIVARPLQELSQTGTGSYVLTLTSEAVTLPPASEPTDDHGTQMDDTTPQLSIGGMVTGVINYVNDLTHGHDQDVFAVALVEGQRYRIEMERTALINAWMPDLEGIYDSSGNLIAGTPDDDYEVLFRDSSQATEAENIDKVDRRQWFTATTTGRHYIMVSGISLGATPVANRPYRLSIQALTPADDYPAGGTVSVGGTVAGHLEWSGDEDRFAVELAANTTYRIDVSYQEIFLVGEIGLERNPVQPYCAGVFASVDGSSAAANVHVSPEELVIGPGGDMQRESNRVHVTPTMAGTYYLAIRSRHGEGAYKVAVTSYAGEVEDLPGDTSTPKALVVGGAPAPGTLPNEADVDWWAVELVADQTYRIDAMEKHDGRWDHNALPTVWALDLKVYNPQGDLAGSAEDDYEVSHAHVRQWFTPTTTGRHYIAVQGSDITFYGDSRIASYELAVRQMAVPDDYPAETPGQVVVGGVAAEGRFEQPGDEDRFTVTLAADTIYRIDLSTSSQYVDVALAGVYDAENNQLANTTDNDSGVGRNARVYVTPTAAGLYSIAVQGKGGEGDYSLAVTVTAKADDFAQGTGTEGVVAVGGSVTGEIEAHGDEDWFGVQFTAETTYRIDVEGADTGQGTLAQPYLKGIYTTSDDEGLVAYSQAPSGTGEGRNARTEHMPDMTRTYYLRITGYIGTGTYRLSVTVVED